MTKKQQQIIAIAVMAVVALIAGGYWFAIKPQLAQKAANETATAAAQTEANTLRTQLGQLQAKQADLPAAQKRAAELSIMFPPTFEQSDWFDQVRAAASRAGVKLEQTIPSVPTPTLTDGTTPAAPVQDPNAPAVAADSNFLVAESAVTLSASGSKAALTHFLVELENLRRPILLENVSLSFGTDPGQRNEGSLDVTGKTFLARPMDPPPANIEVPESE